MKRNTVITCKESNLKTTMTTMVIDGSYQQINASSEAEGDDDGRGDNPHDSEVIIHVVPENEKSRWNHIEDLDSFFSRMYHYHQKHGFTCMMLQEILELVQFIFVVSFTLLLVFGINYAILFELHKNKTSITDAMLPLNQWTPNMGFKTWSLITVASIFLLFRVIKVLCHFVQFRDIQSFYKIVLKIKDNDLDNLTWHEIQKKLIEVQKEQEMCVHKRELTELDIYHRILRFKNYMVAMINKSLLPIQFKVPYLGDVIFMTQGLKYNLEFLLFWGPGSPFQNNWHLREDYKKLCKRQELAKSLAQYILWIGIVNFILSPVILLWQILYSFFNYGEMMKREPGTLGIRSWSLYGKIYLRHFNELDHELNARLNRAYRPASRYMSLFTSPLITIISKTIGFISGSICCVLLILACYDEDLLNVNNVLTLMSITGGVAAVCNKLIPDENLVWCPETLLTAVLAHTHYRPDKWRHKAHTHTTRLQVSQLFQYRAVHLLEELLSPILTPYILCFRLRYRALDIVDFYRNFTIEVTGVGDICSFAQMDVKKHGDPLWQTVQSHCNPESNINEQNYLNFEQKKKGILSNKYTQAEDGKTELSLIHFMFTNPEWKPPSHAEHFVTNLQERAKKEAATRSSEVNPFFASLNSLSSLGPQYNDIVTNIRSTIITQSSLPSMNNFSSHQHTEELYSSPPCESSKIVRKNLNKAEGPLHIGERSLLYGLQQITGPFTQSFSTSVIGSGFQDIAFESTLELTTLDMSLSAMYLHELHHRQIRKREHFELERENVGRPTRQLQELEVLSETGQERAPLLLHQDSSIRKDVKP